MKKWCATVLLAGLAAVAGNLTAHAQTDLETCANQNVSHDAGLAACERALTAGSARKDRTSRAELHFWRARRYLITGEYDRAIRDLNVALAALPKNAHIYVERGAAWLEVGEIDRSIADLNQALLILPGNAAALVYRARAWKKKGDLDQALADLDQAIRVEPSGAIAYYDRAAIWRSKKVFERALADLGQAIRLNRLLKYAHFQRGGVLIEQQLYDRAIADFDTEIRLSPEHAASWRERGLARLHKGDWRDSIADFDRAIELDPGDSPAWFHLATARSRGKDYDRAIAAVDRAMQGRDGKNAYYISERAGLYALKGDFQRALVDFDEAVRVAPNNSYYHRVRAVGQFRAGNIDRALADAAEAVRLDPKSAGALSVFCVIRVVKGGEVERALPDCEEALRLDPKDHSALGARAMILASRGEYRRAVEDYDKAIALGSRPRYLVHRGLAFEALGDRDRARADFAAALTAAEPPSKDRDALQALAREKLAAVAPTEIAKAPPREEATSSTLPPQAAAVPSRPTERRVALVIGNSQYRSVEALPNPGRDAGAVADVLRQVGFQSVVVANDLTRERMIDALRAFAATSATADWSLVYFAGHGIEVGGQNYVIPVDAKLQSDRDTQYEAITLEQIVGATEGAKKLRLLLLDACRENPFINRMQRTVASRSIGRGLSNVEPDAGMLVVFAAKHGQIAFDGDGVNSPFVSALIRRMLTPQLEIRKLFDLVRDDVMAATGRRQQPFSYGSVPGNEDFYFTR